MSAVILSLDRFRQFFLGITLKNLGLIRVYQNYETRTLLGIFISTLFSLPLAIFRPDLVLALGPLIFGYPHLMASYRYLIARQSSDPGFRPKIFFAFSLLTLGTLIVFQTRLFFSDLYFGVWPPVFALLALFSIHLLGLQKGKKGLLAGALVGLSFAFFAWTDSLLYGGAVLMIHNFVAYAHWFMGCSNRAQRRVAFVSGLFFSAIHLWVWNGGADRWLVVTRLSEWQIETTAWSLASWAPDALTWYRFLVLYAFGLSMHYFVWLRAIPETEIRSGIPLCFRLSFEEWRHEFGKASLQLAFLGSVFGLIVWLRDSSRGQSIYFQIALLHGSLELVFLPKKVLRTLGLES
jgi:hypothetical protein